MTHVSKGNKTKKVVITVDKYCELQLDRIRLNRINKENLSSLIELIKRRLTKNQIGIDNKEQILCGDEQYLSLCRYLKKKCGITVNDWINKKNSKILNININTFFTIFKDIIVEKDNMIITAENLVLRYILLYKRKQYHTGL